MSYIFTIEEFDKSISTFVSRLEDNLEDIVFDSNESVSFIVSDNLNGKHIFPNKKLQGVYLFELNLDSPTLEGIKRSTKIKKFAESWSKKKNDSFFSSSVIRKRFELRANFNKQWLPIYIGKSKDIYKRIAEHIDLSPDKNTYAMKLKHRGNLNGLEFRVSTIEFNIENYDFIIPFIERSLREKYIPLIGKQ